MDHEKRYQANPVVSCGTEDDGAVLYNPDTDEASVVNLTGRELWLLLDRPRTAGEIVEHLLQTYSNVTVEQATGDVALFIETLVPDFLLEITNAG